MERKTHKENIGHVSGGVHKGEINKEEAKDVKEEEVPRQERRIQQEQRHTQGKHGIRNGTTERIGTEKWRGRQGLQKGEDTGTEDTHRESTEDAQEATHENTSYILR